MSSSLMLRYWSTDFRVPRIEMSFFSSTVIAAARACWYVLGGFGIGEEEEGERGVLWLVRVLKKLCLFFISWVIRPGMECGGPLAPGEVGKYLKNNMMSVYRGQRGEERKGDFRGSGHCRTEHFKIALIVKYEKYGLTAEMVLGTACSKQEDGWCCQGRSGVLFPLSRIILIRQYLMYSRGENYGAEY